MCYFQAMVALQGNKIAGVGLLLGVVSCSTGDLHSQKPRDGTPERYQLGLASLISDNFSYVCNMNALVKLKVKLEWRRNE